MATIEKHNGSWRFRVQSGIDPKTGHYTQITKSGFRTKKAAQLAAHKAETELAESDFIPSSKTTFDEFAAEWLKLYAQDVKISSVRIRSHQLGILSKGFGARPIQRITARIYEQFLSALVAGGFSVIFCPAVNQANAFAALLLTYDMDIEEGMTLQTVASICGIPPKYAEHLMKLVKKNL